MPVFKSLKNRLVIILRIFVFFYLFIIISCKQDTRHSISEVSKSTFKPLTELPDSIVIPENMVWIPGGSFSQGAHPLDTLAMQHEKSAHEVILDGFFMDKTEVTNQQFSDFVNATGYITTAERAVDWEELKKQLPEGTEKPDDSLLLPGSLIFKNGDRELQNPSDYFQWWKWKIGANWKHPFGPESNIIGKNNEPVVHISYEDAQAYCKWTGKRLPTEAEWEYAALGIKKEQIYSWGNQQELVVKNANTWQGNFPDKNTVEDGYAQKAPAASFPPNDYGLYDMLGNVWEWTSDWYNTIYYQKVKNQLLINPQGAVNAYNPYNAGAREKIIKGGSYLCNINYCASYRVSARMATSTDSSLEHLGFRTVLSLKDLRKNQNP